MKKSFVTILSTSFTIVGSIIGAGFISGRELVRFFGGQAVILILAFTFLLLTGYLFLFLNAGKKWGGFASFLFRRFGKGGNAVKVIFLVGSFVIVTSMLAGINALAENFAPFISILVAISCFFIVKKGMKGVRIFAMILVPLIVLYVAISLLISGNLSVTVIPQNAGMGALFVWLYVAFNLFLSAPVLLDLGAGLQNKKEVVFAALLSSILVVGCIALILSGIAGVTGAAERTIPLLYVLRDGKLFPLVSFFAIVTTLITSYYPLHTAVEGYKKKDAVRLLLLAAASVCAIWGLEKIVDIIYPVLGVLGILFSATIVFDHKFFHQGDEKIHYAGEGA